MILYIYIYIYIYIYMKFHAVMKCLGIRANDEDEGMTQSQVLLYVVYHIYFAGYIYLYILI